MREVLVKNEEFKDSPVGRIPKDWNICRLKDLTDSPDSITYGVLKPGEYVPNGVPLLQIQDVIHRNIEVSKLHRISKQLDAQYSRTRLSGGEIVMSLVGTIGRVAQIPSWLAGANLHRNLARIQIYHGNSSRFVYHYLQSSLVQQAITASTFGSTQSLLNLAVVRELLIAVPPKHEQQIIAEILDTVDDAIARTSSLITKLKQTKAGLLQDLLTRGLDENGELRDPQAHPEQFKDSPLGKIPKEWQVLQLSEVTAIENGTTPSREESKFWNEGTIPWLTTGKVHDRIIVQSDEFITNFALQICSLRLLPVGTILVAMIGQGITRGKVAYLAFQSAINQNFGAIFPCLSFNSKFLFHYLDMNYEYVRGSSRGSNQQALNCSVLGRLQVICPLIKEQNAISTVIDSYDQRIRQEEAYLNKLKLQKQGLMQDLLTGKVRVKNL